MIERVGISDVVSQASRQDTILVLPTLKHAVALWPVYRDALVEAHGAEYVNASRTAVTLKRTHTVLRLGVPYSRDPTLPTDWLNIRRGFVAMTPYLRRDVHGWRE